ncbi:hypothetical protein [Azorhizobium sp. AG788]|uniref:hypothetical protein n=1 Tax=Azorhizobium sp. AG788 TaxID=2183897 RepID=UPI00313A005A
MTAPMSMRPREADTALHPIHMAARRMARVRHQSLQLLVMVAGTIGAAHVVAFMLLLVRP